MRKLLILLSIFITANTNAQQIKKYYDYLWKETAPEKAVFAAFINKTDSGWLREDYFTATGKLQMQGLYKDSSTEIANGWFRFFYSNGRLESFGHNVNDKKEGLWIGYHTNGMMRDSIVYENNEPVGVSLGWYSNGFIEDSIVYGKNYDTEVYWYDNGTLSAAGRTIAGKPVGPWNYYHKNGNAAAVEVYKEGNLISRQYYDENGKEERDTPLRTRKLFLKEVMKHGKNLCLRPSLFRQGINWKIQIW